MPSLRSRGLSALDQFWEPIAAWRPAWLAGLIALALYASSASTRVHMHDPAEFQTLARTGGIAHSGYPTPVLILQAFAHLPFGTLPWRANMASAVFGAIGVGLLAYAATRWTRRGWASVVAALAFAMSLTMWREGTLAGVHSMGLAIGAALLLLVLRYAWWPSLRLACAAGLLFGLGITSHLTLLGIGAPLLVAFGVGLRRSAHRTRHIAGVVFSLALGLSPFLYLIASDRPEQPMNYLHDTLEVGAASAASGVPDLAQRVERVRDLVTGKEYLGGIPHDPRSLGMLAIHLALFLAANEFPFVTWLLAGIGLAWLLWRRGAVAGYVALWLACTLVFVGIGATGLTAKYFFLPGAWCMGLGLAWLLARVGEGRAALAAVVAVVVLAMPFVRMTMAEPPALLGFSSMLRGIWQTWPNEWCPWRGDPTYDTYGRGVMQRVAPRAVVLGGRWDESVTLRYFEFGEPLRPDVDVLYAGTHAPRLERLWRAALAAGRPAYVTQLPDPGALPGGRLEPVWDAGWKRLWRIELALPDSLAGP